MKSATVVASLAFSAALLPGCSVTKYLDPYLVDIRQGNYVTQDMMGQLKPGMNKDQVRFVLGTPLIADVFHADRWDYLYRFKPGRGEVQQRHVSVFFDQGKLVRVGGDVVASGTVRPETSATQPQSAPKVIEIGVDGRAPEQTKPAPVELPDAVPAN